MAQKFPRALFYLGYVMAIVWSVVVIMRSLTRIVRTGIKGYFNVKVRSPPAALSNPELGTHGYLQLSEVKLHYVSCGREDAPLMLCVHGFPEFWYSWRHQLKEFSKDYRVVAIDMRGYGDSDKPRGKENYTLDKLVGDVREVIPGLGYERCSVLLAHDWGGMVAWTTAHAHPDLVERLVVCNCPHAQPFLDHVQSSWKQLLMSWYIFFFQLPVLPELVLRAEDLAFLKAAFASRRKPANKAAFTADDVDMYKYVFAPPGRLTGPINYYRAIFHYGVNVDFPTEKVTVPSLMVWGQNDRALSKVLAEKTAALVEDYRVRYIDASHWVQQEAPTEVNTVIRQFLAGEI